MRPHIRLPADTAEMAIRLTIVISSLAAMIAVTGLDMRLWRPLEILVPATAAGAAIGGRRRPRATITAIAVLVPAVSGLMFLVSQLRWPSAPIALAAAVLGLGASTGRQWAMPPWWRSTLGLWALVIALTWPIIALREIDFTASLLWRQDLAVTGEGISAPAQFTFVAWTALVLMTAVLWTDTLWRFYAAARIRMTREVMYPMVGGVLTGVLVAFYQALYDITFLNSGTYGYLRRASGLLVDANAFGVIAALAGGVCIALAVGGTRWPWYTAVVAALACLVGVWLSGSRTALLCAGVITLCALWGLRRAPHMRRAALSSAAGAAIVVTLLASSAALRPNIIGPVERMRDFIQASGQGRPSAVMWNLWDRDRYGSAAMDLLREYPLSGIGIGAFHAMVVDRMYTGRVPSIPPDNAQNWFRHQLVEFGILGSVGWILFVPPVAWLLGRSLRLATPAVSAMGGTLIGLATVSLFGVPTQHYSVLLVAAAVFVWWRLNLLPTLHPSETRRLPSWVVCAVALSAVAASGFVAVTQLRVPFRAAAAAWPYEYGWSAVESTAEGPFRWTTGRAVSVLEKRGRYLRVRFSVRHPDLDSDPVDVRIKLFRRTIIRERFRSPRALVRYIEVPEDLRYVMLTFYASRTFSTGGAERGKLGLAVDDWEFVDSLPPEVFVVK